MNFTTAKLLIFREYPAIRPLNFKLIDLLKILLGVGYGINAPKLDKPSRGASNNKPSSDDLSLCQ